PPCHPLTQTHATHHTRIPHVSLPLTHPPPTSPPVGPSAPSDVYKSQPKRLGPEVYSNSEEDSGLVGSGGESTWRFRVAASGDDRLELVYRRPWEKDAEPAESFSCAIQVR
uniref:protease inhibitor I42 family protein n=1 Tax=Pseudomonas aeruginosa TaxID=287 RepID=UPI0020B13008